MTSIQSITDFLHKEYHFLSYPDIWKAHAEQGEKQAFKAFQKMITDRIELYKHIMDNLSPIKPSSICHWVDKYHINSVKELSKCNENEEFRKLQVNEKWANTFAPGCHCEHEDAYQSLQEAKWQLADTKGAHFKKINSDDPTVLVTTDSGMNDLLCQASPQPTRREAFAKSNVHSRAQVDERDWPGVVFIPHGEDEDMFWVRDNGKHRSLEVSNPKLSSRGHIQVLQLAKVVNSSPEELKPHVVIVSQKVAAMRTAAIVFSKWLNICLAVPIFDEIIMSTARRHPWASGNPPPSADFFKSSQPPLVVQHGDELIFSIVDAALLSARTPEIKRFVDELTIAVMRLQSESCIDFHILSEVGEPSATREFQDLYNRLLQQEKHRVAFVGTMENINQFSTNGHDTRNLELKLGMPVMLEVPGHSISEQASSRLLAFNESMRKFIGWKTDPSQLPYIKNAQVRLHEFPDDCLMCISNCQDNNLSYLLPSFNLNLLKF